MKATTKLTREYLESLNSGLYTVIIYNKLLDTLFISSSFPAPDFADNYVIVHGQQGSKNNYAIKGNIRATQKTLNEYILLAGL